MNSQDPPREVANLELLVSAFGKCPSDEDVRLPTNGALRIGSALQVVTYGDYQLLALRNGTIRVYGRALQQIAGVPLIKDRCRDMASDSTGWFGSVADILPQFERPAAMRIVAVVRLHSWHPAQNGQNQRPRLINHR
jgi:hypothetical protein